MNNENSMSVESGQEFPTKKKSHPDKSLIEAKLRKIKAMRIAFG
jgi:hypothetical protein